MNTTKDEPEQKENSKGKFTLTQTLDGQSPAKFNVDKKEGEKEEKPKSLFGGLVP